MGRTRVQISGPQLPPGALLTRPLAAALLGWVDVHSGGTRLPEKQGLPNAQPACGRSASRDHTPPRPRRAFFLHLWNGRMDAPGPLPCAPPETQRGPVGL